MIYSSMIEAASLPRLIYPFPDEYPNLVAVVFEYMKRLPALFCVEQAMNFDGSLELDKAGSGLFVPVRDNQVHEHGYFIAAARGEQRKIVIETSSGNMAVGLAEVCKQFDIPLYLLLPSRTDQPTQDYVRKLGAEVEIIGTSNQDVRVRRMDEIKADHESKGWVVCWINQYSNPNNWRSYWRLAELLVAELDHIDKLVAPVGTGGSSRGIAFYLRGGGFRSLELVGVDACGSVNFDHGQYTSFLMSGLGSSRMMPLIDRRDYDVVHWLDDATAFAASRRLFESGIPVGGSSGAAIAAARHEAATDLKKTVVVICPDHARRYASTIHSEEWLAENKLDLAQACKQPRLVDHPDQSDPSKGAAPAWYRIDWRGYLDRSSAAVSG